MYVYRHTNTHAVEHMDSATTSLHVNAHTNHDPRSSFIHDSTHVLFCRVVDMHNIYVLAYTLTYLLCAISYVHVMSMCVVRVIDTVSVCVCEYIWSATQSVVLARMYCASIYVHMLFVCISIHE